MSDTTLNLSAAVYSYLKTNSLREPNILGQLRHETNKRFQDRMQISPEQGQFMRLLIDILNAKKTLDIGTFTGYSALAVALSLPENGKVIACDTSIEWTDLAKQFWEMGKVADKIELKLAPATQTLDGLLTNGEQSTFDFAFIDADKQNYITYYEKSLALLRTGGLIAIDNVLWGGKVADLSIQDEDTVAIRKLNSFILNDERVTLSMLPVGDGLTLVRKK
ncbi:MAG: O-methyltransferase [marine bacterium B5-7]|nr:MAG: O-methyltransferase [marine bacterium B5-7]